MSRYRCPNCKSDQGLWEMVEIPGWRSVDAELKPVGGGTDREGFWGEAEPTGEVGCGECQWEGFKRDLERMGIDGEPLPDPNPNQIALEVEQ